MERKTGLSVLYENLSVFRQRQEDTSELRHITVRQLIDLLSTEADAENAYACFVRALPDATGEECLLLCHAQIGKTLPSQRTHAAFSRPFRISCMETPASHAFFTQTKHLSLQTKLSPIQSFSQGCEEVLDGKSDACLLPLFSTVDGKLYRFYDMLERYDLKVLLAGDIDAEDGEQTVRYALAGHESVLPCGSLPHLLEFSVTESGFGCTEEIPLTAKACGTELFQIDSLPLPFDTGLRRFYFTLRIPQNQEEAFRLYLSLRYPGYTLIGSYPLLPRTSL